MSRDLMSLISFVESARTPENAAAIEAFAADAQRDGLDAQPLTPDRWREEFQAWARDQGPGDDAA